MSNSKPVVSEEALAEIEEISGTPIPGHEIEQVEILDPEFRGFVVIAQQRELPFEITIDWLLNNLAGSGAALQLDHAALVIVTDPMGQAARVLKNDAQEGEFLSVHTAAIG